MKNITATLKAIFHIVLVTSDTINDVFYFIFADFYNKELRIAAIVFILLLPSIVYFSVLFVSLISKKDSEKLLLRICFSFFWLIAGLVISSFYPLLFCFRKFANKKYKNYYKLSIIEFLIESLPQLIIQGYNNAIPDNWSVLYLVSLSFSIISLLRGGYILANMLDYSKKYSNKFSVKPNLDSPIKIIICLQILPMLACWICNIMYVFLKFDNELIRYLCFFLFISDTSQI